MITVTSLHHMYNLRCSSRLRL